MMPVLAFVLQESNKTFDRTMSLLDKILSLIEGGDQSVDGTIKKATESVIKSNTEVREQLEALRAELKHEEKAKKKKKPKNRLKVIF